MNKDINMEKENIQIDFLNYVKLYKTMANSLVRIRYLINILSDEKVEFKRKKEVLQKMSEMENKVTESILNDFPMKVIYEDFKELLQDLRKKIAEKNKKVAKSKKEK